MVVAIWPFAGVYLLTGSFVIWLFNVSPYKSNRFLHDEKYVFIFQ